MADVPRCFIARPVSMRPEHRDLYRDGDDHWTHVHEYLLRPALSQAGFDVVPPTAVRADLIHANIVRNLNECELVLADFSGLNPNVLFEAGIRTAVNKPIVIVAEKGTALPFDTNGVNTWNYDPALEAWVMQAEIQSLVNHIEATSLQGNALWSKFGVQLLSAQLTPETSAEDARLQVLTDRLETLSSKMDLLSLNQQHPVDPQQTASAKEAIVSETLKRLDEAHAYALNQHPVTPLSTGTRKVLAVALHNAEVALAAFPEIPEIYARMAERKMDEVRVLLAGSGGDQSM
jgi:hypothetical protein